MITTRFRVKTVELEANKLRLHSGANRELQPTRVKKLERTMDLDALGRFSVWRDGRNFYVIDGQHRKVALENLGLGDMRVRCDIYEGMSFPEACEQFLKLNDGLGVRAFDKFDKAAKAGYEAEVETRRIVEAAGLKLSPIAGEGKLTCVMAATEVWKLDRGLALTRALNWMTTAWGTYPAALEGQLLRGLGIVASRYNGEVEDAALITKLAKFSGGPSGLQGRARTQREIKGGTIGRNLASIVVDVYNKGRRRGQLPPI